MADDFKTLRDALYRTLLGRNASDADDEASGLGALGLDASAAKALISGVFARAGKGKDEVVQVVAREIGLAVAAMLKEPLAQLAKHQKLQISFEFVPKHGHEEVTQAAEPPPARAYKSKHVRRAPSRRRPNDGSDS